MPEWARDERLAGLEVYRVGGAIRDELLGLVAICHFLHLIHAIVFLTRPLKVALRMLQI